MNGDDLDDEVFARRLAAAVAAERGETAPDVTAAVLARAATDDGVDAAGGEAAAARPARGRWLAAAAVFLLGLLTVLGVALLERTSVDGDLDAEELQQPVDEKLLEVTSLEAIAALPRDLRAVELRNVQDSGVVELVARCPDLEHLRVWASTMARREHDVPESITDASLTAIARLAKLRRLELVGTVLVTGTGLGELAALPLLESLTLRFFDVGDEQLEVLPRLPSLRELDLSNNQVIGPRGLAAVGRCVGLRRLKLHAIPGQPPAAFTPLAQLTLLESLDLTGINQFHRGIADEATQQRFGMPPPPERLADGHIRVASLQDWPRLHTLSLGYSRSLEAEVGAELRRRYPRLRELDLVECQNIDGTTIEQLAEIPTLRRLVLTDCANVDERAIRALVAAPRLQVVDFGTYAFRDDNSPFLSLADAEALLRSGKRVDWHPPPDRRPEFEVLKRRYAGAYTDTRMELVRTLAELDALPGSVTRIECRGLGDRAAALLAARPAIVALEIVGDTADDRLTGTGLAAVCRLPRLQSLVLMNLGELRGPDFQQLQQLRGVRALTVVGCALGDEGLAVLPKLERLEELHVSGITTFTGDGVRSIGGCRSLRTLGLANCTQLDAGSLTWLEKLEGLATLDISGNPRLGDRDLMGVAGCRGMRRLDLHDGTFSGESLRRLAELSQLNWIDLSGNQALEVAALQHLPAAVRTLGLARCAGLDARVTLLAERLPELTELDIGQNHWVTDDVLGKLVESTRLQRLDLLRCRELTGASLATIREARSLRHVVVTGTACMSAEQQVELMRLRPELTVVRQVW